MTKTEMIEIYEKNSKADKYILGYVVDDMLYMCLVSSICADYLKIEKASRNQGDNLRLRMTKAHTESLLAESICLGSADILIGEKYNKGENFEKAVTEYYGQEWHKDTVPFYIAGDININGVEIQIKLNSATLMNTKQAVKLTA